MIGLRMASIMGWLDATGLLVAHVSLQSPRHGPGVRWVTGLPLARAGDFPAAFGPRNPVELSIAIRH